jgi:hypothetical protein
VCVISELSIVPSIPMCSMIMIFFVCVLMLCTQVNINVLFDVTVDWVQPARGVDIHSDESNIKNIITSVGIYIGFWERSTYWYHFLYIYIVSMDIIFPRLSISVTNTSLYIRNTIPVPNTFHTDYLLRLPCIENTQISRKTR